MAVVNVKGTFMSASLKTSTFEGNSKHSVQIDLYQQDSTQTDKLVIVKCEDLDQLTKIQAEYDMGSIIELQCSTAAYKNQVYYKLLKFVS